MREQQPVPGSDSLSSGIASSTSSPVTVPVVEEHAVVTSRIVDTGRVRVDKTVTSHDVDVEQVLVSTDVRVERVKVDPPRVVDVAPPLREEGDVVVVPVLEERLVVEKRLVVTEEVRITRATRHVHDPTCVTLRRERVTVERLAPEAAAGTEPRRAGFVDSTSQETVMERMLVGVFDTKDQMDTACRDLQESGIPNDRVHIHAGTAKETLANTEFAKDDGDGRGTGFFDRLFGSIPEGERHARLYGEALRRGGFVVVVDGIDEDRVDEAVQLLERDGAYDIDERAAQWRASGWRDEQADVVERADTPQGRTEEKTTIPVVEEQLNVGKREVERGGVRVFTHTTERPVEENVMLREERARVERRPVDRPATEAELGNAFEERSVELRETAEEPVVAKTARVVEEVDVGTEVSTRTETVRDTVRRRDVDVEPLAEDLPQSRVGAPAEGKRPSNRR